MSLRSLSLRLSAWYVKRRYTAIIRSCYKPPPQYWTARYARILRTTKLGFDTDLSMCRFIWDMLEASGGNETTIGDLKEMLIYIFHFSSGDATLLVHRVYKGQHIRTKKP